MPGFRHKNVRLPDGALYSSERKIKAHCESDCVKLAEDLGFLRDWNLFFVSKVQNELCLLPSCLPRSVEHLQDKASRLYYLFFLCDLCTKKCIQPQSPQDQSDIKTLNDVIVSNRNGLKTGSDDQLLSRVILNSDEAVNRLLSTLLSIPSLTTEIFSVKDHNGTAYDLSISCDCVELKAKFNSNCSDKIPWNLLGEARAEKSVVLIPYCGSAHQASALITFMKRSKPVRNFGCSGDSIRRHSAHGVQGHPGSSDALKRDTTTLIFASADSLAAERLSYRLRATRAYVLQIYTSSVPAGDGDKKPSERVVRRSSTLSNFNRQFRHTLRRLSLPFVKRPKAKKESGQPNHAHSEKVGTLPDTGFESVDADSLPPSIPPKSTFPHIDETIISPSDSLSRCSLGYTPQTFKTPNTIPFDAPTTSIAAGEAEVEIDIYHDPMLRSLLSPPAPAGPPVVATTVSENRLSSFLTSSAPETTYSMGLKAVNAPLFSLSSTPFRISADAKVPFANSVPASSPPTKPMVLTSGNAITSPRLPPVSPFEMPQSCTTDVHTSSSFAPPVAASSQNRAVTKSFNDTVISPNDASGPTVDVDEKQKDRASAIVSHQMTELNASYGDPTISLPAVDICSVPRSKSTEPLDISDQSVIPTAISFSSTQVSSHDHQRETGSVELAEKPSVADIHSETTATVTEIHVPNDLLNTFSGVSVVGDSTVIPPTSTFSRQLEPSLVCPTNDQFRSSPDALITTGSPSKITYDSPAVSSGSRIRPPSVHCRLSDSKTDALARTPEFPSPYIPVYHQTASVADSSGLPTPKVLSSPQSEHTVSDKTKPTAPVPSSTKSSVSPSLVRPSSGTPPTPVRSGSTITSVSLAHSMNPLHTSPGAVATSRIRPPSIDPGLRFKTAVAYHDSKPSTLATSAQPAPNNISPSANNIVAPSMIPQPASHYSPDGNASTPASFGSQLRYPTSSPPSGLRPPTVCFPASGTQSRPIAHSLLCAPSGTLQAPLVHTAPNGVARATTPPAPTSMPTGIRPPSRVLKSS